MEGNNGEIFYIGVHIDFTQKSLILIPVHVVSDPINKHSFTVLVRGLFIQQSLCPREKGNICLLPDFYGRHREAEK